MDYRVGLSTQAGLHQSLQHIASVSTVFCTEKKMQRGRRNGTVSFFGYASSDIASKSQAAL